MNITGSSQKYNQSVEIIKDLILESQYNAVTKVNAEQLALYYRIGCYVSVNSRTGFWGQGAIEYISTRLQKEMPGLRGFSERNIKYMRSFYEAWCNSAVATAELQDKFDSSAATDELDIPQADMLIHQSLLTTFSSSELQNFLLVPFTQHYTILSKVKELNERLFYIHLCANEHLTVKALVKAIEADEFHHQHQMPSNFSSTIKKADLYKKAILAFKDEYQLDFINTEELGIRDIEDVDERVVENAIVHNIKSFIMTLGNGFSFIGNQYHINVLGHDHFIDLLFFNRYLSCLVAVELKNGPFKPSYFGQLNTYLRVLDDCVRPPHENQSIGIILCRDADKNYVEYVAQDYEKPMGVAVYRTSNELPERLRHVLPDIDELKKLLDS